jgi:hypothetical protein
LTSGKWKEFHDKKEKVKEDPLKEKDKRKAEREEKELLKPASQKTRTENASKRHAESVLGKYPKVEKNTIM